MVQVPSLGCWRSCGPLAGKSPPKQGCQHHGKQSTKRTKRLGTHLLDPEAQVGNAQTSTAILEAMTNLQPEHRRLGGSEPA